VNLEQLKKNVGQRVRLRPIARRFDESGREQPQVDDVWLVQAVTDVGVSMQNERTGHTPTLGRDHVYSYSSDPGRSVGGLKHGFLTLHVQLFLRGVLAEIEPTARPGEPALNVPPAMAKPLAAVTTYQQRAALDSARQAFMNSPEGIGKGDAAFNELCESLAAIAGELKLAGQPDVSVRRHGNYAAVAAFTYGISTLWERSAITLRESELRLSIWDRTPPFPGSYSLSGQPKELRRYTYTYGFVPPARSGWLSRAEALSGLSSEELARLVFDDLAQRPRRSPMFFLTEERE
jgi:hypothetical protein